MNTTRSTTRPPPVFNGVAALSHLGVIKVIGEDAAKFIHGQLTQDFALLDLTQARLTAFCSAKGRMQASFIGFKRSADEILLVCSKDILLSTLKRLSMFVMRAKAKLSDASEAYQIFGLAGDAIMPTPSQVLPAWTKVEQDGASIITLYPAQGTSRQLWVAPTGTAAPSGQPLSLDHWMWGEVQSAVATLTAPVVDAFVPQMLNYESIGGVNFKKGCYPGQEVVARSQFRGSIKRRVFLAHTESPLAAGNELFAPNQEDQPVATVVQAAAAPDGGFDALISAQLTAAEGGILHLGNATGPKVALRDLPYDLLDDV